MIRRLLYLNTHRLTAYTWQRGRLQQEAGFDHNDDGWRRFADYLAQAPKAQYALLANIAEEGYAQESIPFVQGRDRSALIARKVSQHFQGTALAAVHSLGYEKTQRKNEKLLLTALTNPAHLAPWLVRLAQAEVALSGIYSVAQLGGGFLKKLGLSRPRCLLLSLQDHSIRESYLANGQTYFSRMVPLTDSSIAGVASTFASESGKLHQYLVGQRLLGRDETLPVFIVAHPQALAAIERTCPDQGPLAYSIIDSHQAAARLGLRTPPDDHRSELLFLQLLAIAPPRQQFAGEDHRHHYRLAQLRSGMVATGLIALLGSGLLTAHEIYTAAQLHAETREIRTIEAELNQRYQTIAATFPAVFGDNDQLRRLTSGHADLQRLQYQPTPALAALSRVLDAHPAVVLASLEWKNGQNLRFPVQVRKEAAETLRVSGNIVLTRGTVRQTLASFDQFVETLRQNPRMRVEVVQRPFDIESTTTLRGGDGQEDAAPAHPFVIDLVLQAAP